MTFVFVAGCDKQMPTPPADVTAQNPGVLLQQAKTHLAAATRIDVIGNVRVLSESGKRRWIKPKYSITDKKVIAQLAKCLDVKSPTSFLNAKYGTNIYMIMHVFAKKKDKIPVVRFTLLANDGIVAFTVKGHRTCETRQPNNELYRRLLKKDFKFVKAERQPAKSPQATK